MSDCIIHIEELDEYRRLINEFPCVMKFTAKWCNPCKKLIPKYQEIAKKFNDKIKFVEIDVDQSSDIKDFENIQGIPLIIFYKNGVKLDDLRISGYNPNSLEKNVYSMFSNLNDTKPEENSDTNIETGEDIESEDDSDDNGGIIINPGLIPDDNLAKLTLDDVSSSESESDSESENESTDTNSEN